MSWMDQLRPATWRGVQFHVDTIDHQAGDHTVVREYPFADLPVVFRMGDSAEEIKFAAYVIGDDYIERRDALRRVLTGDGILMHPTIGTVRAHVAGKYQITEAPTERGGMARFSLTFVRTDAMVYTPGIPAVSAAKVMASAELLKDAVQQDFAARWAVSMRRGWIARDAVAWLRNTLSPVYDVINTATRAVADVNGELLGTYAALSDGLRDLVAEPRALAAQVALLFDLPGDMTQALRRDLLTAFAWTGDISTNVTRPAWESVIVPEPGAGLVMYGTGTLPVSSVGAADLAWLTLASNQLLEGLSLAAWCQVVTEVELTDYAEAIRLRAWATAALRRHLMAMSRAPAGRNMPTSDSYTALMTLYTDVMSDLQHRSSDLVRWVEDVPQSWEPVWVTSYRIYGTTAWADEISANNAVRHPLFVAPGQPLRIVRHT